MKQSPTLKVATAARRSASSQPAAAHLDVQVLAVHAGSLWPNAVTASLDVPELHEVVDRVHSSRRQLLVWGPTLDQARHLASAGVDAMVVDDVPRHVAGLAA